MSYLRVLICRVDEDSDAMTELACVDLPPTDVHGADTLNVLEGRVARVGQRLLGRLCELQWDAVDTEAVARYCRTQHTGERERRWVRGAHGGQSLRHAAAAAPGLCPPRWPAPCDAGQCAAARPPGDPDHARVSRTGLSAAAGGALRHRGASAGLADGGAGHPQRLDAAHAGARPWRPHPPRGADGSRLRRGPTAARDAAWWVCRWSSPGAAPAGRRSGGQQSRQHWPSRQVRPPEGVTWADWERVRAARAEDAQTPLADLRRLGPEVAPGQMLLVLDEVLTRAQGQGQFHELRTACLLTADTRRYLSGRGSAFLRQVQAAVTACVDQSLLVVADGASWIRTFYRDYLADLAGSGDAPRLASCRQEVPRPRAHDLSRPCGAGAVSAARPPLGVGGGCGPRGGRAGASAAAGRGPSGGGRR